MLDGNSGLGCEHGPVGSQLGNIRVEAGAQAGAQEEAQALTVAAADATVSAYLDCEADFTSLSRPGKAVHLCHGADLFSYDSAGASDAMSTSEPGFESAYSSSCSTGGTHTTSYTYSHRGVSSCAGGIDVLLELDSSNSGVDTHLPVACSSMHTNFANVRLASDGVDSFSLCPPTMTTVTPTSDSEEIETWMRALASRPMAPPSVLNHRGMQITMSPFLVYPGSRSLVSPGRSAKGGRGSI